MNIELHDWIEEPPYNFGVILFLSYQFDQSQTTYSNDEVTITTRRPVAYIASGSLASAKSLYTSINDTNHSFAKMKKAHPDQVLMQWIPCVSKVEAKSCKKYLDNLIFNQNRSDINEWQITHIDSIDKIEIVKKSMIGNKNASGPRSDDFKEKQRARMVGNDYFKGRTHSDETKSKISASKKNIL